jgi:hypothetical protein
MTMIDDPDVPRPYAVLVEKSSGKVVQFSTYAARAEADLVVKRLRELGCIARVLRTGTSRKGTTT